MGKIGRTQGEKTVKTPDTNAIGKSKNISVYLRNYYGNCNSI